MDINQVRFGNYSIANSGAKAKKQPKKEEQTNLTESKNQFQPKDANNNAVLDALNLQGLQNKAQILPNKKELDIDALLAKYSTPESQDRIANMMNSFDLGVNKVADTLDKEFPGVFSDENKNAFAASIYAQN